MHHLAPAMPTLAEAPSTAVRPPADPPAVASMAARMRLRMGELGRLMQSQALFPMFQPIANAEDGSVYAHEALIRGPAGTALHGAEALFRVAREEDVVIDFELFCVELALAHWGRLNQPGRLFVNISAGALVQVVHKRGRNMLIDYVRGFGISPRMLVFEITEHERVSDMQALVTVVQEVRSTGAGVALDDFGDGRSSLRLWSELRPDYVKIDKYFSKDISLHADKLQTLRALKQIAVVFGTVLVAEGIETEEDLRVLRDLCIGYGQGYLLGRPDREPRLSIREEALGALNDQRVTVLPELRRASHAGRLRSLSIMHAPTVSPGTSNNDVEAIFHAHPDLHAVAVVDDGRPVAIMNRQVFMQHYAQQYFKEIFGRKPCLLHANHAPRLVERDHDVDDLVGILTSQDQRYLVDGFIVTDNGRYVGLGTGEQLVRSVTEVRLEAARHANPLTFLPGNIPISQHIERLLQGGAEFVACYADLNSFKPFNDHYGYWRGDEMIRLVAKVMVAHCDAQRDFVGHVGGDDFVILFQSSDWQPRCERIVDEFRTLALALFDEAARLAGGIEAEDRDGTMRFFPCTTLSIGAQRIRRSACQNAEEVATLAALAKHDAKRAGAGLLVRAG
jgi:diguanylate cyclase (GGDEF)-like protein